MSGEIRTKIVLEGAQQTQAAIKGLRKEIAAAEADSNRGAGARGQAAQKAAAEEKKAATTAAQAAEALAKAQIEASKKVTRETEQNVRKQVQAEREGSRSRLQIVQQFAASAMAVYQSVSQRASALSGAFGGRSREAMLSENMNIQMQMSRVSRDIGVQRSDLRASVTAAARASGIDPSQIMAGIASAGDVGGAAAAQAIVRNASAIGRSAQAVGTDFGTVASPLAQALRSGLPADQIQGFLDQYTGLVTNQGINPEALAGRLGAAFSTYGTATGQTGGAAVTGAMRLQGMIGAAFGGGDRAVSGQYEAVMGMLQDQGFQRRLQSTIGTTGTMGNHIGGPLSDPLQTIQALAASGNLATNEQFARLAGSQAGGETLATLINARRQNGSAMQDILGASQQAGAEYTAGVMQDMQGVAGFGNQANQMANFMENGDGFSRYADAMADSVDTLNSKFPGAVEGLDNLSTAIEKVTQTLGFLGMAGGASAAAGAAGGAGVAGGVGGGAGAAGLAAGAPAAAVLTGAVGGALVLAEGVRRGQHNAAAQEQFDAAGGEAGRAERAVAARSANAAGAHAAMMGGFFGPGGSTVNAGAGAARPLVVSLDRASADALATSIGARVGQEDRRGTPERR